MMDMGVSEKVENSLLMHMQLYYSTGSLARFLSNLKNCKNAILIRISSNFLHNIRTCICIKKNYKMENSLLAIIGKIWPKFQ